MGGQLWNYFAPHDNDVNAALQRLRKDVFARGDYHKYEAMTPEERRTELEESRSELGPWLEETKKIAESLPPELAHQVMGEVEKFRDEIMKEDAFSDEPEEKPETIDQLLEMRAESGTWSILDITHISEEPEFGAISPMPLERIEEIFGTDKPSRKMVENKIGYPELADDDPVIMEGWQGYYFTVYRDGQPHELFFVGSSGD